MGRPQVAHLARRDSEGENTAVAVHDQVDLDAASIARAAYGLTVSPFFRLPLRDAP